LRVDVRRKARATGPGRSTGQRASRAVDAAAKRQGTLPPRSGQKAGTTMFESVEGLVAEYADLEAQLADPAVHTDQSRSRKLGRRYAELRPVIATYRSWKQAGEDAAAARELGADDPAFRAEAEALLAEQAELADKLHVMLLPRDALDDSDVILEIKAGEGGEESALFAGDLLRMYLRYAERRGWKTEVLEAEQSDLGGYKDVTVAVKAKGTVEPGEAPFARLKYEGGVHRVQRVPATESQGRIHTSAAGVLVLPETEDVEVEIDPNDLRIDVYRSSGPGGQSVNTTDSAVRITHIPTGTVVSCQNEKSQLQNKESAMRILRARLIALAEEAAAKDASDARRLQVRTVDRSERIRTYNFPENRISDHRVGFKAYNLDAVLDGELEALVQACVDADLAARMAALGGGE
jgi:peptide chain release factor 1